MYLFERIAMGYVNDQHMSLFISPGEIGINGGSWEHNIVSNKSLLGKSAADEAFYVSIPIPVPANSQERKGSRLKSIDVFYSISLAAADDFEVVELNKMALPANGNSLSGAAVACSLDEDHDTAAERKAVGAHTMRVSLDEPVYVDDDEAYFLYLAVDAAATTVFSLAGARANYELRI